MSDQAKRFALLVMALSVLAVLLVACGSSGPADYSSSGGGGVLDGFKTPNPALWTPTPTFPPFTIGAWPSNYSPLNNDTVTIYVLCRVQHADMSQPPDPAASVPIHIDIQDPFTKSADGTTDAEGLAAIPMSFSDPKTGYPVRVYVAGQWGGKTWHAETFFTPAVETAPTATPAPSPTG
jgi:hypothetical protein